MRGTSKPTACIASTSAKRSMSSWELCRAIGCVAPCLLASRELALVKRFVVFISSLFFIFSSALAFAKGSSMSMGTLPIPPESVYHCDQSHCEAVRHERGQSAEPPQRENCSRFWCDITTTYKMYASQCLRQQKNALRVLPFTISKAPAQRSSFQCLHQQRYLVHQYWNSTTTNRLLKKPEFQCHCSS